MCVKVKEGGDAASGVIGPSISMSISIDPFVDAGWKGTNLGLAELFSSLGVSAVVGENGVSVEVGENGVCVEWLLKCILSYFPLFSVYDSISKDIGVDVTVSARGHDTPFLPRGLLSRRL